MITITVQYSSCIISLSCVFLQEAKLFIGLGFPYEGPAPLEAIANGCFFLNPKLTPPVNRVNTKFFTGKPTLRSLSSQNPYTEEFISEPYVFTIDASNSDEMDKAVKKISQLSVSKDWGQRVLLNSFISGFHRGGGETWDIPPQKKISPPKDFAHSII